MARTWARWVAGFRAASIQVKIMGMAAGLVLLLGAGAILFTRAAMVSTVGAELDKRGVSLARDVAARSADPLLTRDTLQLYQILRDTVSNNSDVRYIFIQTGDGRVMAHTFTGGFPSDLSRAQPAALNRELPVKLLQTDEGRIREAAAAIYSPEIGIVRLGMSETGLYGAVLRVELNLLLAILAMAVLGIVVAWWLTRLMSRPVVELAHTARAASAGDLSGRVEAPFDDEVGELVHAFNHMLDSLAESRDNLKAHARTRTELLQKVMTAQEDERKRIARELHDETGQAITSLMVGLKLLEQVAGDPDDVRARSADLRVFAARTLDSVRQLSRQLRPSVLDDAGLVPALRRHIDDFARHYGRGVDLQVVGDESRRLPMEVETAAYRIVQEALTNVARHAQARSVSVVLDLSGDTLSAVVEDDGVGFDTEQIDQSTGILGMRERATLLGGTLTIESRPGAGATIFVKLPIGGGTISCAS
ncbi:MAG TPA: histidine kinase [Symbiobacteriaceae bacterium]|jgi:signal transduction histidine kinase